MAEHTIDIEELLRLARAGADIQTEDRPTIVAKFDESMKAPTKIDGFDALLVKMTEMIAASKAAEARANDLLKALTVHKSATASANEARASADLAREKRQLEVLSTLQQLINKPGREAKSPDMKPLQSILTEILSNTKPSEYVGYKMTFDRDRQGWIDGEIMVTPVYSSQH